MALTFDQISIFILLAGILGLLIWGRWRYDIVAFAALMVAVSIGVVPSEKAFEGFGHPATIIIALVLVVSHGLTASGAVHFVAGYLTSAGRSISTHIAVMASMGGLLSGVMNNVGALALLMPIDIAAARKAGRAAGSTLMPLSFATILGGLITLIGTPPNIIVSTYREQATGTPFQMFDFTPVGLACATVGIAFVAVIGWRLIPRPSGETEKPQAGVALDEYIAELTVGEGSKAIGLQLVEFEKATAEAGITLINVIRGKHRLPHHAGWISIQDGDVLLIEAAAETLDEFASGMKLSYVEKENHLKKIESAELEITEAVVRPGTAIEGRTSASLSLLDRYGIWLVGLQRSGRRVQSRVRRTPIQAGDVLLLLGTREDADRFMERANLLPLAERGLTVSDSGNARLASAAFAIAILLSSLNYLPLPIALGSVCVLYVAFGIVPLRSLYQTIEWPVIVLIGSLIPIGIALETSGATTVVARGLVDLAAGLPAWAILTLIMVLTMTLSDVLNNTATAVIVAPISVEVARQLGANPDAFLMAVAISASCAFLTPIGHQNNTLIMGPGGYGFGDYWQLGLPLEILVIAVGVPMILLVWPL